jgi:hypothetical protein
MDWEALAALAGLLAALAAFLAAQSWWIKNALDGLGKRVDDLKDHTGQRIDGLGERIDALREDTNTRLGELRADVRGLDDRLRGLERERS